MAAQRLHNSETIARHLVTHNTDSTSQGPINEIRIRSSGRLGGTVGHEDMESITLPADTRLLKVVTNTEGVDFIASVVRVCIDDISKGEASKLNLRTVVTDNVLDSLTAAVRSLGANIEGRLSIGEGQSLVYIGFSNGDRRLSTADYSTLEREALHKQSLGRDGSEVSQVVDRLNGNGHIRYELFDNKRTMIRRQDYDAVASLLRTFEYSYNDAIRNVTSTSNTVVLAFDRQDQVIGIALTEHHPIRLSTGKVLYTAELTDFVVHDNHSRNKISYTMAGMLLESVFSGNIDKGPHVVFAEANITNHIVTTFSMLGGNVVGVIPNHINTVSSEGKGSMQSFAIMQFTRGEVESSPLTSSLRA